MLGGREQPPAIWRLRCSPSRRHQRGGLPEAIGRVVGHRQEAAEAGREAGEEQTAGRRLRLMLRHKRNMSRKEGDANLDFACEAVMNRATEHNLVALLDKWSTCWKHRGRTRAIGPHAYEKYSTLGFFGHGGVFGISRASQMKNSMHRRQPFSQRANFYNHACSASNSRQHEHGDGRSGPKSGGWD